MKGTKKKKTDSQSTQTSLFESLNAYPFASDSEFRNGLAVILGRPGTSATDEEVAYEDDLVLQAKCFYFSRLVTTCLCSICCIIRGTSAGLMVGHATFMILTGFIQ